MNEEAPSSSGDNVPVLLHSAQEDGGEQKTEGYFGRPSTLGGGALLLQGRLKVGMFQLFQNMWGFVEPRSEQHSKAGLLECLGGLVVSLDI